MVHTVPPSFMDSPGLIL